MNKYKLYMILGIIVLVLSVGSSFAYYIWKSTSNAVVSLNVCTPTITFAGGSTINGVDMIPVLTKEEGTIKDIEVKKNSTCNRDVTMNLYLDRLAKKCGVSAKVSSYTLRQIGRAHV